MRGFSGYDRTMTAIQMTEGKILPQILKFTFPLMLGNILQQTYSLIDAAIVGKMLGVNALASVGASVSIVFLILGFCQGCCCGFAIPVAQKLGARDMPAVRRTIWAGLRISLYLSVVICIVTSLFCDKILAMMKTPQEIFDDAYSYLLITFISIPFTFFYNLFSYLLRALGDSRTPFYFLLLATVINIVLDIFFIGVLGTGVGGAAVATLIAQAVSALFCYIYMKKHYPEANPLPEEKHFNWHLTGTLLWIGIPIGLQFSITAIGSIVLQTANNVLGPVYVAAYAAAARIKMFFFSPLESLGMALATFAGQNFGAVRKDRISAGTKISIGLVMVYSVTAFAIIYFGAAQIAQLFVSADEAEVIAGTAKFLIITTAFFPFLGLLCVLRYSIQGCGFTALAMLAGVFEMVARTVVGIFGVPEWGYTAVCFGDPMAWIAANIFLVPAYMYVCSRLAKLKGPALHVE